MIGAEQCGRNSFLMELDTLYCDVIVDRFQTLQVSSGLGTDRRISDPNAAS